MLVAAKILRQFGGYTLKTLLDEPWHIFLALGQMALRAQADEALFGLSQAIDAALSGRNQALEKQRGLPYVLPEAPLHEPPPKSAVDAAQKLSETIANGGGVVKGRVTFADLKAAGERRLTQGA